MSFLDLYTVPELSSSSATGCKIILKAGDIFSLFARAAKLFLSSF